MLKNGKNFTKFNRKKKLTTLITGASRGIGLDIARHFLAKDHNLVLLVKNKADEEKLKKKLNNKTITIISGDLSEEKIFKKIEKKNLKINNLINNAAVADKNHFLKVNIKKLEKLIKINLISVFRVAQIISKNMVKHKIAGNIINISSQLGHVGAYNRCAYSMSKFAIEGLTRSMALDLAKFGIRVMTVCPTKTLVNKWEELKQPKRLDLIKKKIPLKRFSTTKEIAEIVFFLTTQSASSITGSSILVDGGWVAGK